MKRLLMTLLASLLFQSIVFAGSIDELSKTVVFLRQKSQATQMKAGKQVEIWYRDPDTKKFEPKLNVLSGTGLVIRYNKRDYLVTARHVAKALSPKAEIVMNLPDGKTMSLTLEWLSKQNIIEGAKWFHHSKADISVHPLCYRKRTDQVHIRQSMLPKQDKDIPLLTEAYIIGFPMGLGVQEKLSPLAKKTQIASRLTSIDNPNVSPDLKFTLLDQALAQGYSGAPVFYTENVMSDIRIAGQRMKAGTKLHFVGIVSGAISDKTGGKIALVVPISYIWDILESDEFQNYEKKLTAD